MERFTVETDERLTVVDVTDRVRAAVPPGVDGVCTASVAHTTAALVVNEAEPRLVDDLERFLDGLVPDQSWDHDELDDNADAHLRATLLGSDVSVPVEDGDPVLGTWGSVLLVECDGPRTRTVVVSTVPERDDRDD